MNIFVRKFNAIKGRPSIDVQKSVNLDFCKTLDILKNFTNEHDSDILLFQETFINSCPLTNGFYYIQNGTISREILPWFVNEGRYLMHFELIQIVSEAVKLLNFRFATVIDKKDEKIDLNN